MNNELTRFKYPLNLQLFAEGDPEVIDNPKPEDKPPKVEFTPEQQAEVDRVIADRIARERKKAEKFADYDELKTKLNTLEQAEAERERSKLTETERLEAEKAAALQAAEDAKTAGEAKLTAANQRIINAEFKSLARDSNVPADRIPAALKLADLSGVTVDDEGNVIGAEEAVKALVAANPYLAEVAKPKPLGGRSGGEEPADKTKEQLLKEAADKARKTGRIEDRMAYSALKDELNK